MTEQEQAEFERLRLRLENTERALIWVWAIVKQTLPPELLDQGDSAIHDYFYANKALGTAFDLCDNGQVFHD